MNGYDESRSRLLVARMLSRAGLDHDCPPDLDSWQRFLGSLQGRLSDSERNRYLLERSLDMTTRDVATLRARLEATMASLRLEQLMIAAAWQRQRALAELGRRAIEGAGVTEMLRAAVELAATAMNAPIATIFQRRDGNHLQLRADVGWPDADRTRLIPFAPDSQAHFVFDTPHGSIVVTDYEAENRFTPARPLLEAGVRSTVSARIGSATDAFGIISVHSYESGAFNADDDIFISELAHVLTLVIDRERHADWLVHKAFHDDLTGLPNRALLHDRLENGLERSRRSGATLTLLLFDLDGFKMINDSRGHAAGDRLLVQVARRLEQIIRDGDTPARLGGDEFAVLLDDTTRSQSIALANRILEALRHPFDTEEGKVFVRASIGIADNTIDPVGADELMVRADLAMYAAKARGRDRLELFTPDMQDELHHRHQLHGDLQVALVRNEFLLYYQPLIDLKSGRLESFEALLRWSHPHEGVLSPDKFLSVADETNLIVPIGRYVLTEACRQMAAWRNDRLVDEDVRMGINVTARQFYDTDFTGDVKRALIDSGLPARNLILELTEGTLLVDTAFMQLRLRELRELGIHIAVDDFGTGYSSLAYLRSFPVDFIKIDRAFVHELRDDPEDGEVMIRSIIGLGHNLNLRVVAEGIEFPDQLYRINDAGCDLGQGYLFTRPLPSHEVRDYLADRLETSNGA